MQNPFLSAEGLHCAERLAKSTCCGQGVQRVREWDGLPHHSEFTRTCTRSRSHVRGQTPVSPFAQVCGCLSSANGDEGVHFLFCRV